MTLEKLCIIIPTKDRHSDLIRLLESISAQNVKPKQIIVVDGGDKPVKAFLEKYENLKIDYIRTYPPSLTEQRNKGIKAVCDDITLISFLDDDIVLGKDSVANMLSFFENASHQTGGAAFNLTNEIYKKPSILQRVFLVNAETPSRVLLSGFQSKLAFLEETRPVQWLVGCATVWRKRVFQEFMFDEWFSGYARYEDVDFSYRVGKKYKLFIVADAKVAHLNKMEDIGFSFSLGKMEVLNRIYFVKKNRELSIILCYWALFGLFINNVINGIINVDKRYLYRAKGNFAGFIHNLLLLNE